MATSLNALMGIGTGALFASQTALQTTGNNVANVNTVGYSRQYVRLETMPSLDYAPGQIGQGVRAAEVLRHFDKFVERNYLNKLSEQKRWEAQSSQLSSLESIFNESTGLGVGSALQDFYASWEKLSQFPDDLAARSNLISKTQTLTQILHTAGQSMASMYDRIDGLVADDVANANTLIQKIADLNRQINMHSEPGKNNPNSLLDQRDQLVRQLSALIDVDVIDKGEGNYIVNMKGGFTLVDGVENFELYYGGSTAFKTPTPNSVFNGSIEYSGQDGYEYTVEFVQAGTLGNDDAMFRVSLDGGKTWMKDENGNDKLFTARETGHEVQVKDLGIYFSHGSGGTGDNFIVGDRFTIVPKSTLYWIEPTIGPINVSPQAFMDGTENSSRAIGGSIGGNLMFRDYNLTEVRDQLDKFAETLIWEVNRLHSQGAGLQMHNGIRGQYGTAHSDVSLMRDDSGLFWKERLQAGNFSVGIYDSDGNQVIGNPGSAHFVDVNFDPSSTDPYVTLGGNTVEAGSLEALADLMNRQAANWTDGGGYPILTAVVTADNKLEIQCRDGYTFGLGNDTTGLLAALGINTFFNGTTASDISVREEIVQDQNLLNAGHINGAGEANAGDAEIARLIAALQDSKVTVRNWNGVQSNQSISNYYGSIVSNVGGKSAGATFNRTSVTLVANELEDRQSEVAGVNLDEEMTNLIKFQSSYKAAAKLITTADQMLQTLLSLKQ
ncbi:MAG: flagellar hook-associated protein FlgK [Deltaproteobacteria bacterium]|jgi:flagellar hook-associated protein 1 FlgK|nr:flagellar hook-associated protein FlgK [Deltaproteobacteria bacterium]